MRSAGPRAFLIALSVLAVSAPMPVYAAEEKPWTEQFLSEFEGIKMRLASIEKAQGDILIQKDKILAEIDRVRIWVRHGG